MARTITKRSMKKERAAADAAAGPPPLFSQGNVRKPEYWQFARLIAPAAVLPSGKSAWTADDAIGIWCERCNRKLQYQKGSSQSIRYHMETKHSGDLHAFRSTLAVSKPARKDRPASLKPSATAPSASSSAAAAAPSRGTKRKERPRAEPAVANEPESDDSTSNHDQAPSSAVRLDGARSDSYDDERISGGDADEEEDYVLLRADGRVLLATSPAAAAAPTSSLITPRHFQTVETPSRTPSAPAIAAAAAVSSSAASATSWHRNVQRRSGFWGNAYWYDLNLTRRMPLAEPMLTELVAALPPCDGKRVLDLCAGSGRASTAVLAAYPTATVTLVDTSSERLAIAQKRLLASGADENSVRFVTQAIRLETNDSDSTGLLGSATPVDVVVACLALHVLAEMPAHYAPSTDRAPTPAVTKDATYERIFRRIFESLAPGGHVVFGDHVGQLGLFAQLTIMARVGFVDVDCAWRHDDSFVAGGRRPLL